MNSIANADLVSDDQLAYEQIIRLLMDAGYYRVQISTMTPFDRVIGGLTWCITWTTGQSIRNLSSADILDFKEQATIGYKIHLSEKLTAVIVQFGYTLEPHQIQGLDYRHLLPIFTQLCKRVKELREQFEDVHRRYVEYLYSKEFCTSILEGSLSSSSNSPTSPTGASSIRQKEIGGDGSEKLKALEKSIADAQAALNERKQIRARLDDELIQLRLKSQQLLDDQDLLESVKGLVDKRNSIKDECVDFRLACKRELKELKKRIKEYEEMDKDQGVTGQTTSEIETLLDNLKDIDQKIFTLQCELNQMADNPELQQYQKRFMELYQEMSQRLIELRRQFTLYNTVESIRAQLSKESTLLKSVYENITKVQNSKLNQDKLSQSLSEWQQTASENLIRAESKVDGAQEQLKKIGDRLAALQDYERKYYKLVRDFHTAITSASASS